MDFYFFFFFQGHYTGELTWYIPQKLRVKCLPLLKKEEAVVRASTLKLTAPNDLE